ncbi:DUF4418 family protein [Christensenellaceae bacterium OttesenSCG-928-K19]|nr:DUF4418 family protein [Christensenellaceae bacterium OttesenSCG-928-K19]
MDGQKRLKYPAGIAVVIFGVLLLLLLLVIVPVCDGQVETASGSFIPMKCHWMSQAVLLFACLLILLGILLMASAGRETRLMLLIVTAACAVCVLLLVTALIGVCGSPTMRCNYATKPALQVFSVVLLVFSGASIINVARKKK